MSALCKLQLRRFRNIEHGELAPSPALSVIHGENGSGKTSLLEAVYLLATGKSFRSNLVEPLIKQEASDTVLFAQNQHGDHFGLQKSRHQKHQLKLNGVIQQNWDQVARAIPAQLIDSSSFQLLHGGSKPRRRFLDWGVFHVEPEFVGCWRRSRKALANRNRLLKTPALDVAQLSPWDRELSKAAEQMHQARQLYMEQFLPVFQSTYRSLAEPVPDGLSISYSPGWNAQQDLLAALQSNLTQDLRYGASQLGPHRADIEFRIGKRKAVELLSRGQQKLLVCALKIAQGKLLAEASGRQCVYLVDDLAAELDRDNRERMLTRLLALKSQLFVTSVDADAPDWTTTQGSDVAMFHMEHGTITT